MKNTQRGGEYNQTPDHNGNSGEITTYPFEVWNYRYIEGIGENINIEFVDQCMCGEYRMTIDPNDKNAMLHVTGGGVKDPGNKTPSDPLAQDQQTHEFEKLEQFAKLEAAPQIKFTDLESFLVNHKVLNGPFFPFEVRTDFVKVTEDTVLVPLTLQVKNRDITFSTKDGVAKGEVNVLGRVATITDHVVQTFRADLGNRRAERIVGQGARSGVGPLVGSASHARPVSHRYRNQGREQSRPRWHLGGRHRGSEIR